MRPSSWFGIALTTVLSVGALATLPAEAVRLSDGKVYFIQPPRLVTASTTESRTDIWGATYYFTLEVPPNAGEPLQRVTVAQRNGNSVNRRVLYDPEETRAFLGTRRDRGTALMLAPTVFNREEQTITVTFDPPVPPGNTVTVALRPNRNPQTGGTYLFGVTAFPQGEPAYGQFLGYGRFAFDEPDRFVPFGW